MPENWIGYWHEFQFLRPWWLWGLPLLLIWFVVQMSWQQSAGWSRFIQQDKLAYLQISRASTRNLWFYFTALSIGIIALAGPGSGSLPGVSANTAQARVFILDLSPSMLARDVKPDRLTIARHKLIDLLRLQQDSESALVVYADHAYQVTPLTDDPNTIEVLVPTLHPAIMPASGSNVESAIALAKKLIIDGGYTQGEMVLITDGLHVNAVATLSNGWSEDFRLSILAVGTQAGAPVPLDSANEDASAGDYLLDAEQNVVIASTNSIDLERLTQFTGGRFSMVTADSQDVDLIDSAQGWLTRIEKQQSQKNFDQQHDAGYWLVLLLIPMALCAFRKNVLWVLLPIVVISPDGHALEWQDLWLHKNQQAQRAFSRQDYAAATLLFDNKQWKAASHYRKGDFSAAAQLLDSPEYADDFHNRGNAQALAGDPRAALVSYRIALGLYQTDESRKDTLHNIRVLRHLLDQMKEQEERQAGSGSASEGIQSNADETASAREKTASGGEQSSVGGATGSGSTLQQQALQEQSSSDSDTGDSDKTTAADANEVTQLPSMPEIQYSNANSNSANGDLSIEENNNKVLSPYSEQWLRELPADPGGYLRRKFGFQAQRRNAAAPVSNQAPKAVRY